MAGNVISGVRHDGEIGALGFSPLAMRILMGEHRTDTTHSMTARGISVNSADRVLTISTRRPFAVSMPNPAPSFSGHGDGAGELPRTVTAFLLQLRRRRVRGDKPRGRPARTRRLWEQSAKPALPRSGATLPEAAQVAKQSPARLRGSRRANCTLTRAWRHFNESRLTLKYPPAPRRKGRPAPGQVLVRSAQSRCAASTRAQLASTHRPSAPRGSSSDLPRSVSTYKVAVSIRPASTCLCRPGTRSCC
jgi:hypothetical protein